MLYGRPVGRPGATGIATASLFASLAAVLATSAVATACSPASPSPAAHAAAVAAWDAGAASALESFGRQIPVMAHQEQQWEAGGLSTAAFTTALGRSESVIDEAAVAVRGLPPYPGQPDVDRLYAASVQLYQQVPRLQAAAPGLGAGLLRTQVVLLSDRVRELADRTFDQGRVLTDQGLVPAGVPAGTKLQLPLEVPDWVAEGLAPGPPLAAAPPPPAAPFPPLRQGNRPTESSSAWAKAVAGLGAPRPDDVAATLADPEAVPDLRAEADRLQAAAAAVYALPDPSSRRGRERSDRLRLAWLIEAEACRAAEAADLAGATPGAAHVLAGTAPALLAVARAVAAGESLPGF